MQRPNWQPTPDGRANVIRTISQLETRLHEVEAAARAKGFEDYITSGQKFFEQMIANELNATCQPNDKEAFQRAREAIDSFQSHLKALQTTKH